jgi:hypothetical protein
MKALVAVGLAAALAAPAPAAAHTLLTTPTPRSDSDGIKSGPCGVARTDSPMVVAGGATLDVQWLETIEHPGYYRLALSRGGDEGFDDNVLADRIEDGVCSDTPCSYGTSITLPDINCPDCTLQLIQFMGNNPDGPYSPYFSCADLVITGDGSGGGDGGIGGDDDGSAGGGCHIPGAGNHSGASIALLVLLALVSFRRRR